MRLTRFIFCMLLSVAASAQQRPQPIEYVPPTKTQLEAKRKELQDEINETEQQLSEIKKDKNANLSELRILQNNLAQRQKLIGNINDEIGDIDNNIRSSSKEVLTLKQKLDQSKIRYAQSIRYAYETRSSYDMLAFLFSSSDFNDAMRRMKYLKKFRDFRKQQVEQIRTTENQLQHKIGELNQTKAQKDKLLENEVLQKQDLQKATEQTNTVIEQLKGKESELRANIEKNRIIANRVNRAIQSYIEAEMAKEAKKAEEEEAKRRAAEAKTNAATPKPAAKPGATETVSNNPTKITPHERAPNEVRTLLLTPTDVALANNFEGNKGKLYWPVEKGYIIDHFGSHPHPLYPKVMINNDGIDIQTDENAPIRAVFDGSVFKVFSADGGNTQIVVLKHGNYFTLYRGLATTSVKMGEQVTVKQVIGHVALNDENLPVINFQIWKYTGSKSDVPINPEAWIGKAR